MNLPQPQMRSAIAVVALLALSLQSHAHAAGINVSLVQSNHGAPGSTPIDLTAEGDMDWGVFANSTLSPSTRMSGGSGFINIAYLGGSADAFYNFYAQNSYNWTNGNSPPMGSNNLTTNANMTSDGDGLRMSFNVATPGTYRLKFYATTSATNLRATATLTSANVSDFATGTVPGGLEKYEFTVDFTADTSDTLTLDVAKDGGQSILAYEAFSLSAVDVTPVPNLNIAPSFTFENASAPESFQIPYNNNGQQPLSISSVDLGGADAQYFTVNSYASSLAVGANGTLALNFIPAGDRIYNASLTIASNDSDSPSTVVNISVNSGNVSQEVDIFILAGQSNANGQGMVNSLTPQQAGPHDALLYTSWHTRAGDAYTDQNYSGWLDEILAGETRSDWHTSVTFGGSPWFGPEVGFAARANAINLTNGRQIAIIKYAVDGSNLNLWQPGGICWSGLTNTLNLAVAGLESEGYTPNFAGMIWWQGENGTTVGGLNGFIGHVRNHLANTFGLQDSANFPVVITGNDAWGAGLKTGVADNDDDVEFVNSYEYGQNVIVHVGSNEGPNDITGNGVNDMYDIGEAYADQLALIFEPGEATPPPTGGGDIVDVFIATGQSNAVYPMDNQYGFGRGIQDALTASGQFSNPTVVMDGDGGRPIAYWWAEFWPGPYTGYDDDFFDTNGSGTGKLEAKINEIIANGDTPRFRGVFWWQGESDGLGPYANANTSQADYETRWNGLLAQLDADLQAAGVSSNDYKFVVNTVAESGDQINNILTAIANADSRGAIYDALNSPYHDQNIIVEPSYGNLHDYNHFAVGQANVQLFIDSFLGSSATYTITFINVDGSVTTQIVNEGAVATPPAGVNTADKTFTAWPTVVPATADATYTAAYTQNGGGGDIVDVFIATGQSNAFWLVNPDYSGQYLFGEGVQAALTASGRFSNPTVVKQGEPGMAIENWFKDGAPQWAYGKNFFGTYQGAPAALEAKIAEIEAAGNTPRFRGVFWFQGEADGVGMPNQLNTTESVYTERWNGLLSQLTSDVGTGDYFFVMNTVGNSGNYINSILTNITNANLRGALFNTQVVPYRTNFQDIHGYDHFAVGEANVQLFITNFVDNNPVGGPYTITFVNVDDSITTQVVSDGVIPTAPPGVNTANRTFTGWPTIAVATEDATYTALYTNSGNGASSIDVSLAQSAHAGSGTTTVDLTAEGALDWGVFSNSPLAPSTRMSGGAGYTGMSYIGGSTESFYNFYSQNNYSWTNGSPEGTGSNNLTSNADFGANGDGVRLTFNVDAAGSYQVKFYATTADTNLSATASLQNGSVSDLVDGTLETGLQRYEYTVEFTTDGADTLTLDVVKSGGSVIFAYEAYSFAAVTSDTPASLAISSEVELYNEVSTETYLIDFSNDGLGDALTLSSVTLGGADAAYFTVDSFTTPVAQEETGDIELSFNPTDGERTYDATLTIVSNDPESPSTVVDVIVDSASLRLGKIICIGDSITEGWAERPAGDGDWSWRYAFWKHLVDHNVSHEFVGTRTGNYHLSQSDAVSVYPDYAGESFVNRHEAIWGLTALERGDSAPTYLAALKDLGETPDTAVVFLGGNDIGGDSSVTAETVRDRIKVIVDNLQGDLGDSGNPDIRILLVSILPRFTLVGGGAYTVPVAENTHYAAINSLLQTLATDEATASSEVTYLDLATSFNSASNVFYDGVHPNGAGEQMEADAIFGALVDVSSSYTITFINVDGSQTVQTVGEGEVATAPPGVNTVERSFTGWPTIVPATADATYIAQYTINVSASISVSLTQSASGAQGSSAVDLTADGGLDWGAWNGELTVPDETMANGYGFTSLTAIGATSFDGGFFYGQNNYSWSNGSPTTVGSTTLAGNGTIAAQGDGVRLTVNVAASGSYQLKFYTTTYDVNLNATASLASGGVSDTVAGSYVVNGTEKYVYTVDFTTAGPDTLSLDLVKSGGANAIFAYEAFSLKSTDGGNPQPTTYEITFINVDGSQTIQTVNAGQVATPPPGVNTADKTFTAWPTVAPANADATYTALYEDVVNTYEITFINVDGSQSTQTVDEGEVATPPPGVSTADKTFIAWPTVAPATADATYTALYEAVVNTYVITFINVDGSQSSQTVDEGDVATPPPGVNDGDKIFTNWPTIAPASEDATYTANYQVNVGAVDITWDGGAADNLWTSAANWDSDLLPVNGDVIAIANGDTVDIPANDWSLAGGITVNVAGNSQITNSSAAARLYGAMVFNFAAGSGLSGAYIDLYDGTLNFEDGATFTPNNIQHRGTTTYGLTLSSTGFTALLPGTLHDAGNEDWSDVTFNLDVSNYDTTNGLVVELIDYTGHTVAYDGNFTPIVNVEAGASGLTGELSFDTASSKVIYTFDTTYVITFINVDGSQTTQTVVQGEVAQPPAGVNFGDRIFDGWPTVAPASADATYMANYQVDVGAVDRTWSGGAGDNLWTTAANWSGGIVPANGDVIAVANGGTIDMPANDWSLPTGITVNVAGNSQIDNSSAAARLYGAMTFNFAAGSGLSGAWIDLEGGTLNFEDGATFTANNIQHRGTTTYGITLSSTGFATLTPGALHSGVDEDWSDVTFNIDASNYDTANGMVLELIDFASHGAAYDANFNPIVNLIDGGSGLTGVLSFDTASSKVIYTFDTKYDITFINVDGSQTTQTVLEGEVATPPAGVDFGNRFFDGWPSIAPATADVTYTANYYELAGGVDSTWSGGAGDDLWTTASNWSGAVLPASGSTIVIAHGGTVDIPANDWSLPSGITVHVIANSQIGNSSAAARLYGAMTFNFASGSGLSGAWIDLQDGMLNFEDGATFTANNIQHRGTTTYGLTLSETGFTTLTPGNLYNGVDEDWSDVTFNLDVTDYDPANGLSIDLIDYASHASVYADNFNPTLNIIDNGNGLSGALVFDAATSTVSFVIDYYVGADGSSFNYVLAPSGYAPIQDGHLASGGGSWADVSFTVDISNYDYQGDVSLVLSDYSSHDAVFDGMFNPAVNIVTGDSGLTAFVSFDPATSDVILTIIQEVLWDGEGGDNSWLTAANWSGDLAPAVGDWLRVGSGANVINAERDFTSLQIESGASVSFSQEFLDTNYFVVEGSLDKNGVFRLQGSVIELHGSLGPSITFLDTNGATIDFYDGAAFDNSGMHFEHKGTNTFGYILSETGFTTLHAAGLWGAGWSEVTFDIDLSAYDLSNGNTIVLVDYSSHAAAFDGAFDPAAVNIIAGASGLDATLTYDTVNSSLVLAIFDGN